ncbi:MAG: tape measure protein [Cyclobacteriaceae bacterium]|nr:tape measure protein [Cyclobacteriaceae bacterium]
MSLEFYIKLREMVSGGLAKMAETARKTTNAIKGTNDTLAQSYDAITKKISSLESVISKSTSLKQIREARIELEKLNRLAASSPGNLSGYGGFFGSLKQLLPAMGLAGALALGGTVLDAGLQGQARSTSFEVMAGKRDGGQLNNDLTKFAQDSIYGNELYQNAQTMLAFGAAAKEIMPDLRMLGDVAMGNKEKLGSLTLAFSQTRAAGKLTGQEVLQFVNAGFNPLQIIAEKTGTSMGVLRKQMEAGQISFQMVKDAFITATSEGGRFYDMTNKIAQTDFGKWEAFKGQLAGVALELGGSLAPAFGFLIDTALVPLVNLISSSIAFIKEYSGVFIVLTAAVVGYAIAVNAVAWATKLWAGFQWILNAAMTANPIGLIVAGIAALIAGIVYAWNKFEGFRGVLLGVWEVGKLLSGVFIGLGKVLIGGLTFNPALMKEGVMQLADTASQIANGGISKAFQAGYAKRNDGRSANAATPSGVSVSGAMPAPANTAANANNTVSGITSAGPRVIHIHINKMVEKLEVHSSSVKEGMSEIQNDIEETLLRILYSGAINQ